MAKKQNNFLARIKKNSGHAAIKTIDGYGYTYKELLNEIKKFQDFFQNNSIKLYHRIGVFTAEQPTNILAILSAFCYSACVPLNSACNLKELDFLISYLNICCLVVSSATPDLIKVAKKNGMALMQISKNKDNNFEMKLICSLKIERKIKSDASIILHTSGTTAKPKIVPLSKENIFSASKNIVKVLKLTSKDICLSSMPLFHVHGLMVAISTLFSGGTLVCAEKFEPNNFFDWIKKYKPTWYTGSPTVHQTIIEQAEKKKIKNTKLRFIRSSSAPLQPMVLEKLESIFQAPVAESYGMTEACLQITSNLLPPGKRKPGSAGKPIGLSLKIVNKKGKIAKPGEIGEIYIKGDNVIRAYENNTEANKSSFLSGWLKTGDLGFLDKDGYLFINGRVKEMINKGGENISPREIDEAILRCPNVMQAVAFSMPHKSLGEDVAAAVILKKKDAKAEKKIRIFLIKELSSYKIPSVFYFVDELPKTAAGKLKRVGLYDFLESKKDHKNVPKLTANRLDRMILKIWQNILNLKNIGLNDNFFEIGGDSLKITLILAELEKRGVKLTYEQFISLPSISGLKQTINSSIK